MLAYINNKSEINISQFCWYVAVKFIKGFKFGRKKKQSTLKKQFFTNISWNPFFFNSLVKTIIITKKFSSATFENYFQTAIYVYHDKIHNTDLLG